MYKNVTRGNNCRKTVMEVCKIRKKENFQFAFQKKVPKKTRAKTVTLEDILKE